MKFDLLPEVKLTLTQTRFNMRAAATTDRSHSGGFNCEDINCPRDYLVPNN